MNNIKEENLALKIIGRFFAVLLSIVLVVLIIGSSVFTSLYSMFTVENVTNIMKNIPYDEILEPETFEHALNEIAEKSGEELNVSNEAISNTVKDVIDSKPVKEILELYSEDALNILNGNYENVNISPDKIKEIFSDNSDEVVDIITDNFPELDKAEVENTVETIIDEHLGEIAEVLPEPEELQRELENLEDDSIVELMKTAANIFSESSLFIVWCAVAIVALLIFVCRLYHFKGLKWIGINALISSLFVILTASVLGSALFASLLDNDFVTSIILIFTGKLYTVGFIVCGVGILFIVGGIVLHYVYNKTKKPQIEAA